MNTSTNNIGIGIGALTQNRGNDNIAIGRDALKYNTDGDYNIAIGKDSGSSENTTIFNTFSYNTFIGYETSIDPSPLTTITSNQQSSSVEVVKNSTAIGYQAKIFEANQIVLGTASEYVYIPKQMSIGKVGASDQISRRPAAGVGLDVSGSLLVSGNITGNNMIMNDISANTLFLDTRLVTNGDISGNGDLFVGGDISGNGNLFVRGNIYKNGVEINSNNFAANQVKALYSDENKNTYVGSNTTLLGGSGYQGLERSTTIGYGANIDVSNQIVLGTSGEFVCIPSNRGLSIGKTTAPTSGIALDVSGSVAINYGSLSYNNYSLIDANGTLDVDVESGEILPSTTLFLTTLPKLNISLFTNWDDQEVGLGFYNEIIKVITTIHDRKLSTWLNNLFIRDVKINNTQTKYDVNNGFLNLSMGIRSLSNLIDNTDMTLNRLSRTMCQYNTSVGNFSQISNTTGFMNTSLGAFSMPSNIDGSNNTAIGYKAGYSDTSGSFNTYLGANTHTRDINDIYPIYNYSTAIGYNAVIDASNQIVLGTSNERVDIPGKLFVNNVEITSSGGGGEGGSLSLNPETIDYLIGDFDILNAVPIVYVFPKFNISLFTEFDLKITPSALEYYRQASADPTMTETGLKKILIEQVYLNGNNIEVIDPNNKSGYNVNNGGCNVAIGAKSLSSVTEENPSQLHNTAVGSFSQMSNTKGSENTSLGSKSLLKNREGSKNVGIGYLAGWNDISGNNNTYLGAETGTTIPEQGYYTTSTAIGSGATITNSNQIVLGTQFEKVYIPGQLWVGDTQITGSSGGSSTGVNSDSSFNTLIGTGTTLDSGSSIINNSTAIGAYAKIDASYQIVLGTSGEFVCIPSNTGLSIGKNSSPTTGTILDVSGSTIVSGDLTIRGTYYGDSSSNIKIGGVGTKSILPLIYNTNPNTTNPVTNINLTIDKQTKNISLQSTNPIYLTGFVLTSTTGFNPVDNSIVGGLSYSYDVNDTDLESLETFIINNKNSSFNILPGNNYASELDGLSSDTKIYARWFASSPPQTKSFSGTAIIGSLYKQSSEVQIIKLYMGLSNGLGESIVTTFTTYNSDYIYVDRDNGRYQPVLTITITPPTPIIPQNSTYLGANITYSYDVDTSTSTAIGYGANIDVSNQIVLGTSGEFVCIPSDRGLSIGKSTAPASGVGLDISGSSMVSGDITIRGNYYGDVSNNIKIGGVIPKVNNTPYNTDPITNIELTIVNGSIYFKNNGGQLNYGGYVIESTTGFNSYAYNVTGVNLFTKNGSALPNLPINDTDTPLIIYGLSNDKFFYVNYKNGGLYSSPYQLLTQSNNLISNTLYKPNKVQTIHLYLWINTAAQLSGDYVRISEGYSFTRVASITIQTFDAINSTYLGANITINDNTSTSTAIGYGANIDVSNQIVLGTSGEFVCIPSDRGLSIGKSTAPASSYVLDVSGSINFSGNLYQNGSIFVSGSGGSGSGTSNSITGGLFVSQDISCNGDLYITGDISGNGDLFVRGSVEAASYNATSDYRIKDNIRNLDDSDTIINLRPVKYLNKQTNKNDFGLIAHELQLEYPDLVSGTKDGTEYQSVNYTGLISILIKEIQDLKIITSNQTIKLESQATQLERINKLLFPND